MNARERVRQALLCRKPDKIPKALGFFDQSLAAIAPTPPEDHFDLDVRFAEFDPPANQEGSHFVGLNNYRWVKPTVCSQSCWVP